MPLRASSFLHHNIRERCSRCYSVPGRNSSAYPCLYYTTEVSRCQGFSGRLPKTRTGLDIMYNMWYNVTINLYKRARPRRKLLWGFSFLGVDYAFSGNGERRRI